MKEIIKRLEPIATKRSFKKRSILLYQGEIPRAAYAVVEGVVKVYTLNSSGEEQIVMFQVPGEIFPNTWLFGKSSGTMYYYEAFTDCSVLTFTRADLHKTIESSHDMTTRALNYFTTNYTGMLMRVTALEQSRASEKIAFTLYYLLFRYGRETRLGLYTIDIPLTQTVIASLVGLTRETTTKELSKLKQMKVLYYKTQKYIIDKQRLEKMLGEDAFKEIVVR